MVCYELPKNVKIGGGVMALGLKEKYLKQQEKLKERNNLKEENKMNGNKKFSKKEKQKRTPRRGFINSVNGRKVLIRLLSGDIIKGVLNTDAYNKYEVEVYNWVIGTCDKGFQTELKDGGFEEVLVVPKHAIALIVPLKEIEDGEEV